MTTVSGGNGVAFPPHFIDLRVERPSVVSSNNNAVVKCEETPKAPSAEQKVEAESEPVDDTPTLDIVINNVVCSFNVRCHLNLRQIALTGSNVEYRRENGMVTMKIRKPLSTASIWSSGRITCTGATSNDDAKKASRKFARILQQLGFRVRFSNYRVVNVLGTCIMPFGINLIKFAEKHRGIASYEPELHPGATFRIKELKATLKIFTTGSITITAPSIDNVQRAVEEIFPLVQEFKTKKPYNSKVLPTPSSPVKLRPPVDEDSDLSEEDSCDQDLVMDSDVSCG